MKRQLRAFTMVEATIGTVLVGVLMVAGLNTLSGARMAQQITADRARGQILAEQLMCEILQQAYEDTAAGPGSFGPNAGALALGNRTLFRDVDDYAGFSETPPRNREGTALEGFNGWTRQVSVVWVSATNPGATSGTESGVKRITISVYRGGRQVASLSALRTRGWQDLQPT